MDIRTYIVRIHHLLNAAIEYAEAKGYEIYWNAKFGHRCNEQAAKQIKNILSICG
ncbi:MAG: hypothetical protein II928_01880 [Paludibacteraceae bacterium]|nr:hypothetical protein [Paludibacteraceae bacterium]